MTLRESTGGTSFRGAQVPTPDGSPVKLAAVHRLLLVEPPDMTSRSFGTDAAVPLRVSRRRDQNATTPIENVRNSTPKDSRLGNYSVIAPLARGGTAAVYLGEHLVTGDRVALKVLDPFFADREEIVERMLGERTISERARHEGLVDILIADRTASGLPYLVMEYLDGENLGTLADRGRIELPAVIAIGAQIAAAVSALHAAGVVHCDIKPENIFVLYELGPRGWPQVKVLDYGVARFVSDGPMTDAAIAGTPCYMPPEQWRGNATIKSDVYALGCLLYELVTGDQPFHGTLPQLMLSHHEQLPERPSVRCSDMPPELERLIVRALAKDPVLRPSMSELEHGLSRLLDRQRAAEPAMTLEATG